VKFLYLLLLSITLSSCSSRIYHLDYTKYPKLPELAVSKMIHTVCEAIPPLEEKVYYGNYGGPGNHAGKPIDQMDEYFRQHDIAYLEGYKYRQLRGSDYQLIKNLKSIDSSTLTPAGKIYRRRVILYFASPTANFLGKPFNVLLGLRKKPVVIPGYGDQGSSK
jgi:hypothetical protein